jgi:hypothetical protein
MPKSRRGKRKFSPQSQRRRSQPRPPAGPAQQQSAVPQAPQVASRPKAPPTPAGMSATRPVEIPRASTIREIRTIVILAAIMVVIIVVLRFVLL